MIELVRVLATGDSKYGWDLWDSWDQRDLWRQILTIIRTSYVRLPRIFGARSLWRDAGWRFPVELGADKIDQLLWEEWLSQQQLFLDHHRCTIICL